MKLLIVNAGSSSLKFQVIDMPKGDVLISGLFEIIGGDNGFVKYKLKGESEKKTINKPCKDHAAATKMMVDILKNEKVVKDPSEIKAVGHRIVSGGPKYIKTTLIDTKTLKDFKNYIEYAPLHNPGAISAIEAVSKMFKSPNYLVFDTAFHQTMPEKAYYYGISLEDQNKYGIRKYGAHGLSHKFVSDEATKRFGKGKIIVCHLGSGSSITAVDNGKSVDTTMGFTPLEGLMMCTRSGDIDASAVLFLAKKKGMTHEEVVNYLQKESGFKGVYGSADMRDIMDNLGKSHIADLAFDMFVYRVIKYIGAYAAAMNGVDTIVFTAGIGERDKLVREVVCEHLTYLGVKLDKKVNNATFAEYAVISAKNSKVNVAVIPTNEEQEIANEVYAQIKK